MTTNGTFSCAKVAKDVDQIIFSIHGLAETHEAITQKPGSFLLARRHIVEASTMTSVSINMVLIKRNFHELNDVFAYFSQRCELSTFYSPIPIKSNSGFDYSEDSLEVTEELLEEYRAKLSMIPPPKLGLKHGYQNIYLNDPTCYTSATIPLANCAAGKYKIVIDYDADVYACNFFRSPEFLCGNILSGDAKEIWHTGKGFNHFRRLSLNESFPDKCNNCIKRFKCAGGCLAWTEGYRNENYENVNDFRCEIGHAFVGG